MECMKTGRTLAATDFRVSDYRYGKKLDHSFNPDCCFLNVIGAQNLIQLSLRAQLLVSYSHVLRHVKETSMYYGIAFGKLIG